MNTMQEIVPAELKKRLASGDVLILVDVREPYEHDEFNIGGLNIPVTELPFRIDELKQAGKGDYVLYCQSGNRSSLAQKLLSTQFKIENTINLKGGVNAWKAEV
jgi:rhodanese-related sulfurtransferase